MACAALYHETIETKAPPPWTGNVFSAREMATLQKVGTVAFVDSKIRGIGVF